MSTLPTTHMEGQQKDTRTNRKVVSAVSIGLAVFGCSMLVTNMRSSSAGVENVESVEKMVDRNLGAKLMKTGYVPSGTTQNLIKMASSPTKSPSTGLHKPTWKPSSKPAEHRTLSKKVEEVSTKKEAKADMKEKKSEIKEDKSEIKTLEKEVKSAKTMIKADKEVVINEETGRPYGLDEDGVTVHAPAKGSKLGQVEGTVVAAANRKDAKDLETSKTKVSRKLSIRSEKAAALKESVSKGEKVAVKKSALKEAKSEIKEVAKEVKEVETELMTSKQAAKTAKKESKSESKSEKKESKSEKKESKSDAKSEKKSSKEADAEADAAAAAAEAEAEAAKEKKNADVTHDKVNGQHTETVDKHLEAQINKHRRLAGSPTKSPSTGLHKPTWRPSSKPAEHRELKKSDEFSDRGPPHVATPTMKPKTSKPVEHKNRALKTEEKSDRGPPHVATPTMKPKTSKPVEHRALQGTFTTANKNGAAAGQVKMRSTANVPPSKSPSAGEIPTGLPLVYDPRTRPIPLLTPLPPSPLPIPPYPPGLHKPTWKPSSKPVESTGEETTSEDVTTTA